MNDGVVAPSWAQPGWGDEVEAWLRDELTRRGIARTGSISQPHVRPWSTVLRVPTTAGDLYLKAVAPALAHEPAITAALAGWLPNCMLPVLAVNPGRHWMLLPDGGVRLRELLRAERKQQRWEEVLALYAEAQIALAERVDDLLAIGAPDRRPSVLPDQYRALLADTAALLIGREDGLTFEEQLRLDGIAPQVTALAEQLAGANVPESLHHGDFHDGNIFVAENRYRFFDWGDCSVAHPFFSLRTVFVCLEYTFELPEDAGESERLRDAYLEPWTRYASRRELLAVYAVARRLAPICSALSWHRVVSPLPETLKAQYAHAVPSLLQEFLSLETAAL